MSLVVIHISSYLEDAMQSELRNLALVAAETAKQRGFKNTYAALLEIVKELQQERLRNPSPPAEDRPEISS